MNKPQDPVDVGKDPGSKAYSRQKSTKRGQIRASKDLETKSKKRKETAPSKSVASKKPKSNQTASRSKEKDISQYLQTTKPGLEIPTVLPDHKIESVSSVASFTSINKDTKVSLNRDRPSFNNDEDTLAPETGGCPRESRRMNLAERYQAEYQFRPENVMFSANSVFSSHQKSPNDRGSKQSQGLVGNEDAEILHFGHFGHFGHDHYPIADQSTLLCHGHSVQDFEPPPSAQPPRQDVKEGWETTGFGSGAHSLNSAVHDDCDNFNVDEGFGSDIDRLLMSEAYPEQVGSEFAENAEVDDWPDDVSMPDAVTIYDEEPQQNPSTTSQGVEAGFPLPLRPVSGNIDKTAQPRNALSNGSENEFDDLDLESSLIDLDSTTRATESPTPHTSPPLSSSPKLKWLPPKAFTPTKSNPKVSVARHDIPQDVPHLVPQSPTGTYLPFIRSQFPNPIRDRSPILGLTNTTVLRTCFRIGEALNAAAQASRSKLDAFIELYARVIASSREANGGFKQSFQFADLFTDKPPYLSGASSIWKGVGLWDQDSRVFLGEDGRGKMCRVVGRIKKGEGLQGGCAMTVLSIWEVDWEDVGIAKGGVCS